MDLWIRTQDKTNLIKVYDVYIYERSKIRANFQKGFGGSYTELGEYATEERALEVLDEIQNILQPKISVKPTIEEDMNPEYIHKHFVSNQKEVDIVEFNTYIYEMPKE